MKKERTVIPQTLNPKLKKKKIKIKIDPQKLLDPIATLDDLDDIDDIDELDKLKTPSRIKSHASSTPQIYSSIKKMRKIDENNFTMMTIKYEAYKQRKPTLYSQWQRDNLKKYIIKTPNNKLQQQPTMDTFKQEGFTDTEKIALMTAVKDCVINSTHAYNATFCRFEGYFTEFILYFGTFNKQTVNDVIVGIQKMHEILSDPYQIISFIDMRHQKPKNGITSSVLTPAPGLSTCYGQDPTQYVAHSPNFGTGLHILIGEHMMQPYQTIEKRALIIYHELTHKILYTHDTAHVRFNSNLHSHISIFGEEETKKFARNYPEQTIIIADCWANFVSSIGQSHNKTLKKEEPCTIF